MFEWSVRNKMRFHPAKCKALSVTMQRNILDNLPFNVFLYELHHTTIDYIYSQTDLGVDINTRLNFNAHCNKLLSKASSNLGLLRRTCHFIANAKKDPFISPLSGPFLNIVLLFGLLNMLQTSKSFQPSKRHGI